LNATACKACADVPTSKVCYTIVNNFPVALTCCLAGSTCSGLCIPWDTNRTAYATCPSSVIASTGVQTLDASTPQSFTGKSMVFQDVAVF